MEDKVRNTIIDNSLINEGDHIVLGLSGGPDSLSLLYVLLVLKEEFGFDLSCVHVNHKLRGEAADDDASFCRKLCESLDVGYDEFEYDCSAVAIKRGVSEEEAGRQLRYESFDTVCEKIGRNAKIAVAQNLNDQCETMLFRLIRGTGPDGLAAMRYERASEKGYPVIRPLLDVRRSEILKYCDDMGLEPRMDHTNEEAEYTRNSIRLELIPEIEQRYNPGFTDALARLGRLLAQDRDHLNILSREAFEKIVKGRGIRRSGLIGLAPALRGRVLLCLAEEAGLTRDMTMKHIDAVLDLAEGGRASGQVSLPDGYVAKVSYDELTIARDDEDGMGCGGEDNSPNKVKASFDCDELDEAFGKWEIEIRTRRPGDYIHLASGRKKIKDLFIDLKIPKEERDNIKMACIGSEVLLVAGLRYSARYRVTAGTRKSVDVEIEI